MAFAFDNRVLFFRLSFSIIDHIETFAIFYETNEIIRSDFYKISFLKFRLKKKKRINSQKIVLFASRNIVCIYFFFLQIYSDSVVFVTLLFLLQRLLHALLIKLFVFARSANVTANNRLGKTSKRDLCYAAQTDFANSRPHEATGCPDISVRCRRSDSMCHRSSI